MEGIKVLGQIKDGYERILTPEALQFLAGIHRQFDKRRKELLKRREEIQKKINEGIFPEFLPETKNIREGNWKCCETPKDLEDRRVEITGPVSRKMVINALNSGAKTFMADFEDATSPTWYNNIEGQINLADAVLGTIFFKDSQKNITYRIHEKHAVLIVRPRGLHLDENHLEIDGKPISGSFF